MTRCIALADLGVGEVYRLAFAFDDWGFVVREDDRRYTQFNGGRRGFWAETTTSVAEMWFDAEESSWAELAEQALLEP